MTRAWHALLIGLLAMLGLGLGYAVVSLPEQADGLRGAVDDQLAQSGVSHPVTAVLLNFRGYDTLLELAVLLLALLGAWSLASAPERATLAATVSPVQAALARVLAPVMLLVAGYLLWVGASAPGGAFQAGAVLAAVWVLWRLGENGGGGCLHGNGLRPGAVLGLAVFVTVAGVVMVAGANLLQYPVDWAGELILLIELAATWSIAVILASLFVAVDGPRGGER